MGLRRAIAVAAVLVAGALPATAAGHHVPETPGGNPFSSAAADQLMDTVTLAAAPEGFVESTVFTGLVAPTSVRFAADGRVFVAEKGGRVMQFDSLADPTPSVFADFRSLVPDVEDRGLLGMALDPQFTQGRPYVYVLYTYDKDPFTAQVPRWGDTCPTPPGPTADGCIVSGRLSRFTAGGPEQVLITDWCQQYTSHSIGDLAFGPDGALYVSGGDGASYTFADYGQDGSPVNPCGDPPAGRGGAMTPPTAEGGALRSQDVRTAADPTAANGALLRVSPDTGEALPDNPNAASSDAMTRRIVAHGFRNPFRFTVRPGSGELWVGDVGWNGAEEIDRVTAPTTELRNFGWPCYEGPGRMGSYDNLNLNLCESLYTQGAAAHSTPYFSYQHGQRIVPNEPCTTGTSSISGLAFYSAQQFPARYRNGLFFADYSRRCIWFMPAGANGLPDPALREVFASDIDGVVGLTLGPDGALYYPDIANGAVQRISYATTNRAPTARASATPTSGDTPLTVQFDGRASSDGDGDALEYAWDLDGDGAFDDGSNATASWTYTSPGNVTARLRVMDPGGLEGIDTVAITAGRPPQARIDAPAEDLTWAVGDVIGFSGGATDPQGAALPASRLTWRLLLQHCAAGQQDCHTHALESWSGTAADDFVAPEHEYPSYLELELTATDASGLSHTVKRRLDPKTVDLTFETAPAGLQLSAGSQSGAAPFTRTVIVGSNVSVSAPAPQSLGGRSYGFNSWSDGGAQNHSITAPATARTYRATFDQLASAPGIVGAWGLDEASGTQVLDSAGPGGPGTISGATRVAGRFGSALSFDGVDDWVTVPDTAALRLTNGVTIEAWVNPTTIAGAWRTAVMKERSGGLSYALYANDGANHVAGYFNFGANDTGPLSAAGALPLNTWTHVATTWDGSVARLYLNGNQVATSNLTGTLAAGTGPLRFGGNGVWTNEDFHGRIDEVRVYDRAITAAQVTGDMNTPVGGAGPAPPQLSVTPASLSFSATQGAGNPAAKSLAVANTGGGTLSFTASDNAPWLSVTPGSGSAPQSLSVSADISGLAPGTHNATVTVTSTGSQGSPATIPVTLTVAPAPVPPQLSVTPASLSFSATQGAGNPAAKSLAVANSGGGTLTFSAADDAPWLLVTPASGTAPQSLSVSADISGLPPGEHTAAVTVTAAGVQGSPATIPVTLTIAPAPPPALSVGPASLAFNATQGGAAPAAQSVNVTNSGGGTLTFSASDDASWLSVAPGGGTAPQTLSVTASQAGLAPGAHTATITVTAAGATGSPKTVAVTLNVATAPPPTSGLVAAYGFDEPSGSVVNDASGTGNPGVITGATRIAAGRFGPGLSFDGVNDWVTAAHAPSLDLTTAMTLEAWVYPTITTGWRTAILKERTAGLTYALYANEHGRRPIGMGYTTNELGARGNATLPVNTWSHLAATYSGGTMRLYRNGAQVGTAAIGSPIRPGNQPLRMGGNAIWNEWFAGRLDEVRIYNRALSVAEVQADMNNPVSAGSTTALRSGAAPAGRSAKAKRNLRRARRRSSLRRERARRDLPLRHHRVRRN